MRGLDRKVNTHCRNTVNFQSPDSTHCRLPVPGRCVALSQYTANAHSRTLLVGMRSPLADASGCDKSLTRGRIDASGWVARSNRLHLEL